MSFCDVKMSKWRYYTLNRCKFDVNLMSVVLLGGKPVFSGTRTQEKVKTIKSPPADIFCYGISKGTTKQDIVDD